MKQLKTRLTQAVLSVTVAALTSCAVAGYSSAQSSADIERNANPEPPVAVDSLERLQHEYGLSCVVADRSFVVSEKHVSHETILGGAIHGDAASAADVQASLPYVRAAISDYPPEFLKSIPLQQIVLCSDLRWFGRMCTGLVHHASKSIYLNVRDSTPEITATIPSTIHHELFHLIDGQDARMQRRDPVWESLNPDDFMYGPEGLPPPDPPPAGFVTPYATSTLAEDKAEVFAAIIGDPFALQERTRLDSRLRQKVLLIRTILHDKYPGVTLPRQFDHFAVDGPSER